MITVKPDSVLIKQVVSGEETPLIAIKGDDGVSPSAVVERVESGAKITITDAEGTTDAMIYDGQSVSFDYVNASNNEELSTLNTDAKTTVSAINELKAKLDAIVDGNEVRW